MDSITVIKDSLNMAEMVGMAYLGDLSDAELMQRPHPQCHHVNWQVGPLICSDNHMLNSIAPDQMPALPDGFAEKYTKETAASDDAQKFATKDELLHAYKTQRAGTLAILSKMNDTTLDEPSGVDYAPTKAAIVRMQGEHWLIHCGQWVIIRRMNNKPVVI